MNICGGFPTGFVEKVKYQLHEYAAIRDKCTEVTHLVFAFLFLGEKDGVDVRKNTSLGDGDSSEELVQLFVISDGELNVTRGDAASLVILGSISRELEKLGGQVLQNGCHVDRSSRANSLGETSLTEISCHAADGEL